MNSEKSWLDHFFLSENLRSQVQLYSVIHDGDNLSDHSAIYVKLSIPVTYVDPSVHSSREGKLNWTKASDESIRHYQRSQCSALAELPVPVEALA